MSSFDEVVDTFRNLCKRYDMPVPNIKPHLPTDPCDYTAPEEVRFNIPAAGDIESDYHARHVFGHFLANLEQTDENSDKVADLIALFVSRDVSSE